MPAFFLIAPPPAYIETVHGLAAMTADHKQWCVPAAEVPAEFRPAGRDPICQVAPRASATPYAACLKRLFPRPEVVARPGEDVRFHVPEVAGTANVTVAQRTALSILGPVTSWRAAGRIPANIGIATSGARGDATYGARVVVTSDVRVPSARVNVRPARRVVEVRPDRPAIVSACFDTSDRSQVGPVHLGPRTRGITRFAMPSVLPRQITIRLESPTGVPKRVTLRVRT
ncbi:MAG: hypothetical protein IT200_08205 [Thermoleophilia bacterium]|nr:hypothetical protein [Thermoleophilia bacterium]